jgi:hypothetical protein
LEAGMVDRIDTFEGTIAKLLEGHRDRKQRLKNRAAVM